MTSCDVVVIGGGIAGVSAAARLIESGASVVLVEAEETLAFHTTGRSAAQYLENYGNDEVRKLTLATKESLLPFLGPRPELMVGREPRVGALRDAVEHAKELVPTTEFLDGDQAREILPILRPELLARNPLYDAEGGSGWRPEAVTLARQAAASARESG